MIEEKQRKKKKEKEITDSQLNQESNTILIVQIQADFICITEIKYWQL